MSDSQLVLKARLGGGVLALALTGCGGGGASKDDVANARNAIFADLASGQESRALEDTRTYIDVVKRSDLSKGDRATELTRTWSDMTNRCNECWNVLFDEVDHALAEYLKELRDR